jgi:8-oxo-dGTP pyrophosphatase MutT (NUDIX family)
MITEYLSEALASFKPHDPEEREFLVQTQGFLKSHANPCDAALEVGHVTASAFLVEPRSFKILLTFHRKLERWLQFGGHIERSDKTILAAAARELREESGLICEPENGEIFDVDVHRIPAKNGFPAHLHYDIRFLFLADALHVPTISPESKLVQWHPIEELVRLLNERAADRVLTKLNLYRARFPK